MQSPENRSTICRIVCVAWRTLWPFHRLPVPIPSPIAAIDNRPESKRFQHNLKALDHVRPIDFRAKHDNRENTAFRYRQLAKPVCFSWFREYEPFALLFDQNSGKFLCVHLFSPVSAKVVIPAEISEVPLVMYFLEPFTKNSFSNNLGDSFNTLRIRTGIFFG